MKFSGTALLGYLCCLLICGKGLHHILQRRGLVLGIFIIPSCILSGFLGIICMMIMDNFDRKLTSDLIHGLSLVHKNLLNFVFAALMLGISCKNYSSQLKTGIMGLFASVFHEGMPMLIYSQILGWGQSAVCLCVVIFMDMIGYSVPTQYASMIPLGLEAGTDVSSTMVSMTKSPDHTHKSTQMWSLAVIEEAESIGLVVVSVLFIICVSLKPFIVSMASNSTAGHRDSILNSQTAGMVESFERPAARAKSERAFTDRSQSRSDVSAMDQDADQVALLKDREIKQDVANLGSHMSLIALVVFVAFLLSLLIRVIEIYFEMERRMLSNLRMFKLAMFCAIFFMHYLQRKTRIIFIKDWFMRISGLMLDLMVVAAFSVAAPLPEKLIEKSQYLSIVALVFASAAWNLTAFYFFAHRLFPNFWFERGLTLSGDAMGHSFLGLLFARTLDPHLESPVPHAYVYKLLLFFIPSSGEKNTIIVSLVDAHGPIMAFVVSINIAVIWLILCEKYFSNRFIVSRHAVNRTICVRSDNPEEAFLGNSFEIANQLDLSSNSPGRHMNISSSKSTNHLVAGQITPGKTIIVNSREICDCNSSPLLLFLDLTFSNMNFHAEGTSDILSNSHLSRISAWLPDCHSTKSWCLKYSLRRDGACLETLMMLCDPSRDRSSHSSYSPCVMIGIELLITLTKLY